ncbi:hypothetical protein GQ607_011432 [Colletotrichum asianum]|uniref:Uncharacterized protein n=1 Tax=Colletotrichum asianum TaxID=702518 RepID=A0A8H3ZIV4_9PEZI|nr:hypothetical protein GQ607_011432 [Colletotrichum asianum]
MSSYTTTPCLTSAPNSQFSILSHLTVSPP